MKSIKNFAGAALFATGILAGSAASAQDAARIVVVSHGQASDPFWSVVKNGVDEAARDYGVTVEYQAPETFDVVRMGQMIEAATASQPQGLVVSIPDADALGPAISNAVASGIPVISMNSGSDVYQSLGLKAHVGQTELEAGIGGGRQMAEAGVKKALCLNQEVGNVALDTRCEGFKQGLGGEVEVVAVSMDPTEVSNAVKAAMAADQGVQGVLALGPTASEPALAALEELGMLESVKLATFDLSPTVLQAIADGKMMFAIDQQQYLQGYLPVAMLSLYNKYGVSPAGVVMTGPGFVTKDNAAQVIELSTKGIR